MRTPPALAFLATALLLTSCGDLLSLHPLYTGQDRLFDPSVEGRWESEDNFLSVDRADDAYEVTMGSKKNPSEPAKFEQLVDIKETRFADLLPMDGIGHMFLRVRVAEGRLHLAFFDSKWLRERIPHEEAEVSKGTTQAVLTAAMPQLRKLVEQFAMEPKAYDEEVVFQRPK